MTWPSPQKLARLRQMAVVPISTVGMRLFVAFSVFFAFSMQWQSISQFFKYDKLFVRLEAGELFELVHQAFLAAFDFVLLACLSVLVVLLLLGLLQSRFLFQLGFCSFSLSHFGPSSRVSWSGSLVRVLVGFPIVLLAVGCLLYFAIPYLASGLHRTPQEIFILLLPLIQVPPVALVLLALLGVVAIGLGRLLFYWSHRMTREEIEKEMRG